jgi:hypothetical protein
MITSHVLQPFMVTNMLELDYRVCSRWLLDITDCLGGLTCRLWNIEEMSHQVQPASKAGTHKIALGRYESVKRQQNMLYNRGALLQSHAVTLVKHFFAISYE